MKLRVALAFMLLPAATAGIAVIAIGSIGHLLARILRALASRHRVFLADATAAQYTRHPSALLALLKRVQAEPSSGTLKASWREAFGLLLFVPGRPQLLLRTHPTIAQRMARLARDD